MSVDEKSLEEKKFLLDAEMRQREMVIKEIKAKRTGLTTAQASIAGAILALFSGVAGAAITAWSTLNIETDRSLTSLQIKEREVKGNLDLEKSKQEATEKLERKKFETSLVLDAIKTPSRTDAVRNLKFFVAAGFIADDDGRIRRLDDESLPSIGEPSVLGTSSLDRDPFHLHPTLRDKLVILLKRLKQEGLDFELFEGFRSPSYQLALYAEGRLDRDGPVTNAKPWTSLHSYGLAADLVQVKDKKVYWGPDLGGYERMHAIAKDLGLKVLEGPFPDLPHIELDDVLITDLRVGKYPPGGDAAWANNLVSAIQTWTRIVAAIQAWGPQLGTTPVAPPVAN